MKSNLTFRRLILKKYYKCLLLVFTFIIAIPSVESQPMSYCSEIEDQIYSLEFQIERLDERIIVATGSVRGGLINQRLEAERNLRNQLALRPNCFDRVRLHGVFLSDDDLTRQIRIDSDSLTAWVNKTNEVFRNARIKFEIDTNENGPDIDILPSTALNSYDNKKYAWDGPIQRYQEIADSITIAQNGKLVVFFRHGDSWKALKGKRDIGNNITTTVFNSKVYMFGHEKSTGKIFTKIFNEKQEWKEVNGNGITNLSLNAITLNNKLYLFSVGVDSNRIYVNTLVKGFRGVNLWSGWNEINGNGTTDAAISATVHNGSIYLFSKGINDRRVYMSKFDQTRWSDWSAVPGNFMTNVPLNSVSLGTQLYIFGKSINEEQIFYKTLTNTAHGIQVWSDWQSVNNNSVNTNFQLDLETNTAVSSAVLNNSIYLIAKEKNSGLLFYTTKTRNSLWNDWQKVPGDRITITRPTIETFNNQINIFIKGNVDNKIHYKSFNGSIWSESGPTGVGYGGIEKYIWMPGFNNTFVCNSQSKALLAHEIGHYFGLSHTFEIFDSEDDAETFLDLKGGNISAFDRDNISDTFPEVVIRNHPALCDINITELQLNTSNSGTNGIPQQVSLNINRNNIMSYYFNNFIKTLTNQQISVVREKLTKVVTY